MNKNTPQIREYDILDISAIVRRWEEYFSAQLPCDQDTENYLRRLLKPEHFSGPWVSGEALIAIEKEIFQYTWDWSHNLYPDWRFWLKKGVLPVFQAVCLTADIDPSLVLLDKDVEELSKRDPWGACWEARKHEYMNVKDRLFFHKRSSEIIAERLMVVMSNIHRLKVERRFPDDDRYTFLIMEDFYLWVGDDFNWGWPLPEQVVLHISNLKHRREHDRKSDSKETINNFFQQNNVLLDERNQYFSQTTINQNHYDSARSEQPSEQNEGSKPSTAKSKTGTRASDGRGFNSFFSAFVERHKANNRATWGSGAALFDQITKNILLLPQGYKLEKDSNDAWSIKSSENPEFTLDRKAFASSWTNTYKSKLSPTSTK